MTSSRLHADALEIDVALVRRLLSAQCPQWASRSITRVSSEGTANALYRLGSDLVARLPNQPGKAAQVAKEHRWLSALGPSLPLSVPRPVALGAPTAAYPSPWMVCRWLPGRSAAQAPLANPREAARRLASFIQALQAQDTSGGPAPGAHNFGRGAPLATRDAATRRAIEALGARVDRAAVTAAWEADMRAPVWDAAPVWVHGDLSPDNLLVVDGRLRGVLDWGGLGVGDPAVDLLPAWGLFEASGRAAFREALGCDAATWARGRGWALSVALIALPYYQATHAGMTRWARAMLTATLQSREGRRPA